MNLWQIQEKTWNAQKLKSLETVYTIGNGYFGTRGSFEEGYPNATPATLLFGVFDKIDVGKEELANAPDWLVMKLFVNGERFRLDKGTILAYSRTLDMQKGLLERSVHWESPKGVRIKVKITRFASLADTHIGAIRYSVTADEQAASDGEQKELEIVLRCEFNLAVGNYNLMHWDTVDQGHESDLLWFHTLTRHSSVDLVQTMSVTASSAKFQEEVVDSDIAPSIRQQGKLAPGETLTTEKIVVMYTSRDTTDPLQAALQRHREILHAHESFDTLQAKHEEAWQAFWERADILIEGDERAQQAIRYNVYQLRISASANDSRYSIAAKGLTGFGYRGHIFHDTEIFMLPYFTYVYPEIARNLLLYRYQLLPGARAKAKLNKCEGAQYPWESTLDGTEATPDAIIHPESKELIAVLNGIIELHITASIAHAVWQYWEITGDDEFMEQYGAEMLLSMAMFWASRAEYQAEREDYELTNVIGPDEWHEHVNNNAYTNYMARWSIATALETLKWLQATNASKARTLTRQLHLTSERLQHWQLVVAKLRIPQNRQSGVFEQFDGFFDLKPLDQSHYKGRRTSYQGILGVKNVQDHRIIKQADVLMLLTVLNRQFDLETKRANWDYYYPITDHDYGSSLTPALHVILACELGLVDVAYDLFIKGALVDLENLRGNAAEGIHDACAGAVWQATILGFAGLRLDDEGYSTSPTWPEGWTRLAFKFQHKGKTIEVDLRRT